MKWIVLDSSPLSLLTHRLGVAEADACRTWLATKAAMGFRALLPEIVDYELRRELLRAGKRSSIGRLDALRLNPIVDYLPVTTASMRLAAEFWAQARQRGRPTADISALDVDVILVAQVLSSGYTQSDFVVATTNVSHISQFVPADLWTNI